MKHTIPPVSDLRFDLAQEGVNAGVPLSGTSYMGLLLHGLDLGVRNPIGDDAAYVRTHSHVAAAGTLPAGCCW